jgi:hypothetical protein
MVKVKTKPVRKVKKVAKKHVANIEASFTTLTPILADNDQKEENEVPQVEKVDQTGKRKFLTCTFCETKQYVQVGRDESSSWCEHCGRCFTVNWRTEE